MVDRFSPPCLLFLFDPVSTTRSFKKQKQQQQKLLQGIFKEKTTTTTTQYTFALFLSDNNSTHLEKIKFLRLPAFIYHLEKYIYI